MNVLWLIVAFVAGAVIWHKVGFWLMRKTFKDHDAMTSEVLEGLPLKSLVNIRNKTGEEIERRREAMAALEPKETT